MPAREATAEIEVEAVPVPLADRPGRDRGGGSGGDRRRAAGVRHRGTPLLGVRPRPDRRDAAQQRRRRAVGHRGAAHSRRSPGRGPQRRGRRRHPVVRWHAARHRWAGAGVRRRDPRRSRAGRDLRAAAAPAARGVRRLRHRPAASRTSCAGSPDRSRSTTPAANPFSGSPSDPRIAARRPRSIMAATNGSASIVGAAADLGRRPVASSPSDRRLGRHRSRSNVTDTGRSDRRAGPRSPRRAGPAPAAARSPCRGPRPRRDRPDRTAPGRPP